MSDFIKPPDPQNHVIYISVGTINPAHPDESTLNLVSSSGIVGETIDNGDVNQGAFKRTDKGDTIGVWPGDTVTWVISTPDIITSILVMDDNKRANVFETKPAPVYEKKDWSGVVDKTILGRKVESYSICWSQDGMTYCYDPIIVVNP